MFDEEGCSAKLLKQKKIFLIGLHSVVVGGFFLELAFRRYDVYRVALCTVVQ